jgi:hypothetical protein
MQEIKLEVPDKEKPQTLVPQKRKRGRPPKADIEAVKNRKKDKPGPHPGDAARIQEFKARLLATGGSRIIDKMIQIALDDNHPGQMAAIKLATERLLPMSLFDGSKASGAIPQISINITSMGAPEVISSNDIIDVTPKEIEL